MKLLSANLIITSLSEQKRRKQQLIIPTAAAAIILYPLWSANLSAFVSNIVPMIPAAISSTTTISPELNGMDGFAAFAFAQKTMWQAQPPNNAVDPALLNGQPSKPGLIGAAIDPAFGQATEVGMLCDYSYDTARDISRCATFATALLAISYFCVRLRASRKKGELTKRKIAKAVFYVCLLTGIVHMVGTFIINNFGGLGAGL